MQLAHHSFAELRPPLQPQEYARLERSIASVGLDQAIVLYGGLILDGRGRYRACTTLGVKLADSDLRAFEGGDAEALAYVQRTETWHSLTISQKSLTAANVFTTSSGIDGAETQEDLAKRYGISVRQIRKACGIVSQEPRLAEFIASREVSIHAASMVLADPARLEQVLGADPSQRKSALRSLAPPHHAIVKAVQVIARCPDLKAVLKDLDADDLLSITPLHGTLRSLATFLQNRARMVEDKPPMTTPREHATASSHPPPQV